MSIGHFRSILRDDQINERSYTMTNLGRTALAIAVITLFLGATSAFAIPVAPFNSSLNTGNSDLTGVSTGPYGSVQVVLNSSNSATITFTALGGYLFIDTGLAGVNLNATKLDSRRSQLYTTQWFYGADRHARDHGRWR